MTGYGVVATTRACRVSSDPYFVGSPSLLEGIEYQSPRGPLNLKVKQKGSDYRNAPRQRLGARLAHQ